MFLVKVTRARIFHIAAAVLLLLLLSFVLWQGLLGETKFPMIRPAENPNCVPVVDAKDLLREFADDSDAALKKYRGRIWIKGMVTEISGPTITLEGPPGICCAYVEMGDQLIMKTRTRLGKPIVIEGTLSEAEKGRLRLFRPLQR